MHYLYLSLQRIVYLLVLLSWLPVMVLAQGTTNITALQTATVLDTDGQAARLGDSWQSKPVVLVFVRQFG